MRTDDHRGRYAGRLKDTAPLRNQLAITGEHDCLGRLRRDIHRALPATVVLKCLGDELSCDGHCRCLLSIAAAVVERTTPSWVCRPWRSAGHDATEHLINQVLAEPWIG